MPDSWDRQTTFAGNVTVGGDLSALNIITKPKTYLALYSNSESVILASGDVDEPVYFPLPSTVVTYASGDISDSDTVGEVTGGILYNGIETKLIYYTYGATMSSTATVTGLSLQVFINDAAILGSKSTSSIILTSDRSVVTASFIVQVNPGDKLNGYITSTAAGTITVQDLSVSIHEVQA